MSEYTPFCGSLTKSSIRIEGDENMTLYKHLKATSLLRTILHKRCSVLKSDINPTQVYKQE